MVVVDTPHIGLRQLGCRKFVALFDYGQQAGVELVAHFGQIVEIEAGKGRGPERVDDVSGIGQIRMSFFDMAAQIGKTLGGGSGDVAHFGVDLGVT